MLHWTRSEVAKYYPDMLLVKRADETFGPCATTPGKLVDIVGMLRYLEVLPTDYVLDLGAHVGSYAVACIHEGAKVRAVEAHPDNYCILHANLSTQCECIHAAVTAAGGTAELQVCSTYSHSIVKRKRRFGRGETSIQVPAVTLDALLEGITVLKCDVEGAEYELELEKHVAGLRALTVEFHRHSGDWKADAWAICDRIRDAGFVETRRPLFNSQWNNYGVWHRP